MQTAKTNEVESAHRLRPRSRMAASTPFRIAASQRSAASGSHASSASRLKDGHLLDNGHSAAAFDRNAWRPSRLPPAAHHGLGAIGRLLDDNQLRSNLARNARRPSRLQPAPNPYSKCSAAFSSCSMMLMLCGHMASQAPHWMQSLARPGTACQLYCCLANSVFSV